MNVKPLLMLTGSTAALLVGSACSSDSGLSGICGVPERGFDIEEASTLQDAQAYSGMHDAVILSYEGASELPAGASWRVKSVEIMPLLPESGFDFVPDGSWVTVEVWDADNPLISEPWRVSQQFFKGDHEWEATRLNDPSTAFPGEHLFTWWRFGFEDFIPTSGMDSSNYLVGVRWDDNATPPLGYSNFNNACELNWTDYADGLGFVLNSGRAGATDCSWPMLRVNLEVLSADDECEGERYSVE